MSYREFLPHPRLRGLVRLGWQVEEFHGPDTAEHLLLPERGVSLTFYAGQSWQAAPGQRLKAVPVAALSGPALAPVRLVSLGLTRALGVDLHPWGARQLFGWRMHHPPPDLGPAFGRLGRTLGALLALGHWDEARQTLDGWLLARLSGRAQAPGVAVDAAAELYRTLGRARIGPLAEARGLSVRQLERHFAHEVGVGAKTLARLIRFEEAHTRLYLNPDAPLAPLAQTLGFADQAHLNREFRALAHTTPRAFAASARRQARSAGPVQVLEFSGEGGPPW